MADKDTIFALSSGGLPSGLAVVRLSGPASIDIVRQICGVDMPPRQMIYREFRSLDGSDVLDRGLVVIFPGPESFTGEDCAEFHLHGGVAVVSRFLRELSKVEQARMAEPGEFSRRAFDNEKMDLTEAEGLADLIGAETESQRKLANRQASGDLRRILENWRERIIRARAFIEAEFDFSDEEDVPDSMIAEVKALVEGLKQEIAGMLDTSNSGEIIRDGYRVALMGAPNAGKSSLLNALALRDVAIVSPIPGTTRDVLEVRIDLDGVPVILSDTAGVRSTLDEIEMLGIGRARKAGEDADLVLWMVASDGVLEDDLDLPEHSVIVRSKSDLDLTKGVSATGEVEVSVVAEDGLDELVGLLKSRVSGYARSDNPVLISRFRHRMELGSSFESLSNFLKVCDEDLTVAAEHLRLASESIGRLTGQVDVEDLLDVVFGEFCIGK